VSAPQWKPGDVGVAATDERFIVDSEGRCFWPGDEDARTVGISGKPLPNDRPLVVIDPEDREQVELLAAGYERDGEPGDAAIDQMQAALRSLIAPPKPVEPTGQYAVVEDTNALEWVRADLVGVAQWKCLTLDEWRDWEDIDVDTIHHEGVTL
jgi:hypothetical protein